MTDAIPLPDLLAAIAQEGDRLACELREVEKAVLPVLLPALASDRTLGPVLQRLDPLLQRLAALSRIAETAAAEAPPHHMPAATACLRAERLATLLPGLLGTAPPPVPADPVALFDPGP